MNLFFLRSLFSIFGLAALAVIGYGLSVQANPTEIDRAISANPADHTPVVASDVDQDVDQDARDIKPGRRTNSGSSYIGIGGNIGLSGDGQVGNEGFAVFSKIGLTRSFSLRPNVLIGDDVAFLLPVTIDFSGNELPDVGIVAPYFGGGAAFSSGNDGSVNALITGGLDFPLSPRFTANTSVNVTFIDDTNLGLQLGVGYNF